MEVNEEEKHLEPIPEISGTGWALQLGQGLAYNKTGQGSLYDYLKDSMRTKKFWDLPENQQLYITSYPGRVDKDPNLFRRFNKKLYELLDQIQKHGLDN